MIDQYENLSANGIRASRYIASWIKVGGKIDSSFEEWLGTLEFEEGAKLSEIQKRRIVFLARNGKVELEQHAKYFLRKYPERKEQRKYTIDEAAAELKSKGASRHEIDLISRLSKKYNMRVYL